MSQVHSLLPWPFMSLVATRLFHASQGHAGTAAQQSPPYMPTACFGYDPAQFPSSNPSAAGGDGIWDSGASCGRQDLVRCLSAAQPRTCVPDQTIQIKIGDYAPTDADTTMVLSQTGFGTIANASAPLINVDFQHVCKFGQSRKREKGEEKARREKLMIKEIGGLWREIRWNGFG